MCLTFFTNTITNLSSQNLTVCSVDVTIKIHRLNNYNDVTAKTKHMIN